MGLPGEVVCRRRDEFGPVTVHQDHNLRYLSFGNEVLQSCVDITRPVSPVFEYLRAMLLGLVLKPQPAKILLLGLGGGSLASALLVAQPRARILAVEQRPLVVELAHQWFALPSHPRLGIRVGDADQYLRETSGSCNLLFTDIYHAEGMDEAQATVEYLAACRARLEPGGLVVCNYWLSCPLASRALNESLVQVFSDGMLKLQVAGGNAIVFAFDGGIPRLDKKLLRERAGQLGQVLDVPLARLAADLWRQNAVALRRCR